MKKILVKKIVGANAISMNSGKKLNEILINEWDKTDQLILDFSDVGIFASPFFNASIGVLLKDKRLDEIQGKLEFIKITDHGKKLLNLVIHNAISFYENNDDINNTELGLDEIRKDI